MTQKEREVIINKAFEKLSPEQLKALKDKYFKPDPWYKKIDPVMWIWGIVWTLFILIFGVKW